MLSRLFRSNCVIELHNPLRYIKRDIIYIRNSVLTLSFPQVATKW